MSILDYRTELQKIINLSAENFFIDPEEREINHKTVEHWPTTLLALSYVLDKNALIIGEPGFGKTTAVKVLSSLLGGYPYDLYSAAQIQGHPDQTFETMIARLDFSKLKDKESVIWLTSAYLPVRVIDEISRLTSGKQDEILDPLQSGRFNYLNATFYMGETPFYATTNNPDDGNHVLILPIRDRFSSHLELGFIGATYKSAIDVARENRDTLLCDPELTTQILDIVNNPGYDVPQRLRLIDAQRKGFIQKLESEEVGAKMFSAGDKKDLQRRIRAVKLSEQAMIFEQMIDAEMNYSPLYGRKRSNDPMDKSNHAQKLASSKIRNALSPRGMIDSLILYAQGLAYMLGEEKVEKYHLQAIAPHALGHRLDFDDDFTAQFTDKKRPGIYGQTKEMYLASELVKQVDLNYTGTSGQGGCKQIIDLLAAAFKTPERLSAAHREKLEEILRDDNLLDHPLVKEYARRLKAAGLRKRLQRTAGG